MGAVCCGVLLLAWCSGPAVAVMGLGLGCSMSLNLLEMPHAQGDNRELQICHFPILLGDP
jgi:hypothetical protein